LEDIRVDALKAISGYITPNIQLKDTITGKEMGRSLVHKLITHSQMPQGGRIPSPSLYLFLLVADSELGRKGKERNYFFLSCSKRQVLFLYAFYTAFYRNYL
jgi:hypothetical protein